MTRAILFLNTQVGLEVAKFLILDKKTHIDSVFLSNQYQDIDDKIRDFFLDTNTEVYDINNLEKIIYSKKNIDYLICVYWPYLLKKEVINQSSNTINFHPAYLPVNRGWYPHVHSIIDGSPAGVTLHEINENADEGDIIVKEKIQIPQNFCAGEAYKLLQNKILTLFKDNWELIKSGKIVKTKQKHLLSNYHKKSEIKKLDFIDIKIKKNRDLINQLRARSFGEKGFAYFIDDDGDKVFMNLKLSKK